MKVISAIRHLVCWAAALALSGCGVGICVEANYCSASSQLVPRLIITGLEGLTIRKNDCYPATVSALDVDGTPMTQVTATATIQASTGVVIYSTLAACETYDPLYERNSFLLTPQSPSAVFYFRSDVKGAVSLSTSTDAGFDGTTQALAVEYTPFDGGAGPNGFIQAVARDGNGNTYVGGNFITYDDKVVRYVARLDSEGKLDTSFGPTGTGLDARFATLAVQSDGKVVMGGSFTAYDGTSRPYVARLNSDGSLDPGFATIGTGLNGAVFSLFLQTDGKVVISGSFTAYNGTSRPYVARLNADGSLDPSFAPIGAGLNGAIYAASPSNDKVVVGGAFTSYDGTSQPYIARLQSDGSLDTSFAPVGAGLNGSVSAFTVQSDGKLMVAGSFTSYNGASRGRAARLNSDGSLDPAFAPTGTGFDFFPPVSTWVQSDGKAVFGGTYTYNGTFRNCIARLDASGALDTGFAPAYFDGYGGAPIARGMAGASDDKVVLVGEFWSYGGTSRTGVLRFNADGSLDTGFGPGAVGLDSAIMDLAAQGDGTLVASGYFSHHRGVTRRYIARFQSDGSLDTRFAPTGTGFNLYPIYRVAVHNDGKVLAMGNFTAYNGTARAGFARLNSDGSLDTGFVIAGSGFNAGMDFSALADGKILFGGSFTAYNGTSRPYLARLNADGSLDTGFALAGSGLNGAISGFSVLADGKILIAGIFTAFNGTARAGLARLNADGSLDPGFAPTGSGFDVPPTRFATSADGKYFAVGTFTAYDGTPRRYIARLNADGSLDTGFAPTGSGLNGIVKAFAPQSDGQLVVGGNFTSYSGTALRYMARFRVDGSLDTRFAPTGTGLSAQVSGLSIVEKGRIVVGGFFDTYNGTTALYFARLTYAGGLD